VIVSVQDPILIGENNEPQPNIALLKPRDDFYEESLPTPQDIFVVIEVSDTTIEYDRDIKLPLYAQAKIPVTVLVNLKDTVVEIHTEPKGGEYRKVEKLKRGDTLRITSFPKLKLKVEQIIG